MGRGPPLLMNTFDNITAPASAVGGAVTVIRISGPDALAIGNKVWQGKVPLSSANRRKMLLGTAGNDQTLAVYMQGPNSYTGDDVVELQCHGGAGRIHIPCICQRQAGFGAGRSGGRHYFSRK